MVQNAQSVLFPFLKALLFVTVRQRVRGASAVHGALHTGKNLRTIRARTLVVHGDRDVFFPVSIPAQMYESIPTAALWIIPNGSHVPIFA